MSVIVYIGLFTFQVHTQTVPQPYMELFQFLLVPVLWERPGNIKALVRLIQAYIRVGPGQVVATGKIEALLGVFQKLISSKANDHEGFNLLGSMIEYMPKDSMANYIKGIFNLLFTRLTSSKTTKFVKSFLVFIFIYTNHYGGASVQVKTISGVLKPDLQNIGSFSGNH